MGEGLVFEVDLAAEEHESHWILSGVCLILNTDWDMGSILYVAICSHWNWVNLFGVIVKFPSHLIFI
jgi:hypothetical protein